MAITDIYQDLIMNPDYMPNRLQNLQNFPPVDNIPSRIDFTSGNELVPGMGTPAINFIDAPSSIYQNDPMTGPIDFFKYRALRAGTPEATAKFLKQKGFDVPPNLQGIDTRSFLDKTKSNISSGIGKGFDLGKAAIGGIASLVTGIPGIGFLLDLFQESPEQKAMMDLYNQPEYQDLLNRIPGMANYNPVYGMGAGYGLSGAIDKRISRIKKTLDKKESKVLEQRLKDLEALKAKEAAVDFARIGASGSRPTAPTGGGTRDDQGDRSKGQTGGYSYSGGKREGFGYGLKKGGLASLI